jgi:hypothetical protein
MDFRERGQASGLDRALLTEWLQALNDSQIATLVRRSEYVYPLINATHIFALTLLVGGILPADLRMLGAFRSVAAAPFLRLMTTIAAIGLALAVLTGFVLFSVKPLEYAGNTAFLAKVSLVAIGTANALIIRSGGDWKLVLATGEATHRLKAGAAISLAVWIGALLAGRWIAFV